MKLLENSFPLGDLPLIRRRPGGLQILWGVNMVKGKIVGLYEDLLMVWTAPGLLFINTPLALIVLAQRKPYIHLERTKQLETDDEDTL